MSEPPTKTIKSEFEEYIMSLDKEGWDYIVAAAVALSLLIPPRYAQIRFYEIIETIRAEMESLDPTLTKEGGGG